MTWRAFLPQNAEILEWYECSMTVKEAGLLVSQSPPASSGTEHEQRRSRERGRHRIGSRLQALSCQHRARENGHVQLPQPKNVVMSSSDSSRVRIQLTLLCGSHLHQQKCDAKDQLFLVLQQTTFGLKLEHWLF
ncbi:uncharacterized protein LOC144236397 [Crocuta crocuta]